MAAGPGVEEDDSSARRTRVPALTRAAAVLREISAAGVPLTLAEVTALTGYPKSSVMGICHALTQERLLSRGVDGTYALGSHVYELASTARAQGWPIHDIGFTYPVDESFSWPRSRPSMQRPTGWVPDCTRTPPERTAPANPGRSSNSSALEWI